MHEQLHTFMWLAFDFTGCPPLKSFFLSGFNLIENIKQSLHTPFCTAYKNGQEFRTSDDGEPGGTAGRPILSVSALSLS